MVDATTRVGMPMDEFIRLYEEAPFELIDGERIPIVPTGKKHMWLLKRIYDALREIERVHKNIFVFSEGPFILAIAKDWVKGSRVPDVMVYMAERIIAYEKENPDTGDEPYALVPDLCVEIVSPNDRYSQVHKKVGKYLEDGVRMVWVVDPELQEVMIHRPGTKHNTTLKIEDTLDGGDVIPEFKLPLRDLFPQD